MVDDTTGQWMEQVSQNLRGMHEDRRRASRKAPPERAETVTLGVDVGRMNPYDREELARNLESKYHMRWGGEQAVRERYFRIPLGSDPDPDPVAVLWRQVAGSVRGDGGSVSKADLSRKDKVRFSALLGEVRQRPELSDAVRDALESMITTFDKVAGIAGMVLPEREMVMQGLRPSEVRFVKPNG